MPDEVPPGTTLADAAQAPEPSAHPASTRPAPATVAPGALSALLAELVLAPEVALQACEPTPGTIIGRFELLRRLGAGGFGVVWEARDRQLGRKVAFKLIRPGQQAELREESLLREAEAAARLSHDNIVALYDVGKSEFGPYLVLELLRGKTLAERLAVGPGAPAGAAAATITRGAATSTALMPAEAVRMVRDMSRGVAHAHASGVVHRDLKPANVFLCDDGRVKVLDFGLAHAFGRRRQPGGTPAYMAPEQWKDAPEDERTDVFALGVILYQALSGALPFADEKEATSRRPAPSLEVAAAPELGPLVARMLEKDPLKRPRDSGEVLAALDGCLEALGAAGAEAGATTPASTVRTRRHPRWRLIGFVAAGAALGAAIAIGLFMARHGPTTVGGKLLITVADIVNETGEKELDVLSGLLVTSLEQSRKLEVMTQTRVLDLAAQAGRKGATRVDENIGRAVALEAKAAALLLPAIRKIGTTYAVELRAVDPVHDQHLFTVSDRASSREGLFDLLDRLSEKARQQLKEDPAELERTRIHLGDAMTRSVEAYQHYQAGVEAWYNDGLRAVALREQLRAIELDPQFAAAHAYLASTYEAYQKPELARPHWEAADRYLDRMPEKERTVLLLFRARGRTGHPDPAEARRLADGLLERWPLDKQVVFVACQAILAHPGQGPSEAVRERKAKAEAALRRVVQLDPGYRVTVVTLVTRFLGKPSAEALELARRAVAARPGGSMLGFLAWVLVAQGKLEEATATARQTLERNGIQSALVAENACDMLTRAGAAAECLPYLRRIMADGLNQLERDQARTQLAFQLLHLGRVREAVRVSAGGRAYVDPMDFHLPGADRHAPPAAALAAARLLKEPWDRRHWLAWFGDLAGAAEADAAIAPGDRDPDEERWYRALVAASQGRHADAVQALHEEEKVERRQGRLRYSTRYLIAETLLAAGDPAAAAAIPGYPDPSAELEGFIQWIDFGGCVELALVRARAFIQLGRPVEAVRALDAVLAFWKEADEDLPLLIQAKAMRARLAPAAR
jgi:tetratricopeptide (TPR) repeat protein